VPANMRHGLVQAESPAAGGLSVPHAKALLGVRPRAVDLRERAERNAMVSSLRLCMRLIPRCRSISPSWHAA